MFRCFLSFATTQFAFTRLVDGHAFMVVGTTQKRAVRNYSARLVAGSDYSGKNRLTDWPVELTIVGTFETRRAAIEAATQVAIAFIELELALKPK